MINLNEYAQARLHQVPRIMDFRNNRELSLSKTYIRLIEATAFAVLTAFTCTVSEGMICIIRLSCGDLVRKIVPFLERASGRNLEYITQEFTIQKVEASFYNMLRCGSCINSSYMPFIQFSGILFMVGIFPCSSREMLDDLFEYMDPVQIPGRNRHRSN